jgi:hypothetical protein
LAVIRGSLIKALPLPFSVPGVSVVKTTWYERL